MDTPICRILFDVCSISCLIKEPFVVVFFDKFKLSSDSHKGNYKQTLCA